MRHRGGASPRKMRRRVILHRPSQKWLALSFPTHSAEIAIGATLRRHSRRTQKARCGVARLKGRSFEKAATTPTSEPTLAMAVR